MQQGHMKSTQICLWLIRAERHAQVRMGPRVLGLLWDLTMAPGALPEVADGRQLVDALMAYARGGSVGIQLVWDYLGKCIAQARLCLCLSL